MQQEKRWLFKLTNFVTLAQILTLHIRVKVQKKVCCGCKCIVGSLGSCRKSHLGISGSTETSFLIYPDS